MSKKKEYAKRFMVEAIGMNNLDVLDEILHPEYYAEAHMNKEDRIWNTLTSYLLKIDPNITIEDQGALSQSGIEATKRRMDKTLEEDLQPDYQIKVYRIIEEGNDVVVLSTHSFIHDKPYFGINPTNQEIKYNAMHFFTFLEGKIVKTTMLLDLYQQLVELNQIVLKQGDEEQIKQYMAMLEVQKLIPPGVSK